MDKHRRAEDAEHDIHLPLDVDKRRRDEVAEREVEDPVARRAQRNGLASDTQWEQLGRVDPADGAPGGCEGRDEEVCAGDDGAAGPTADLPGLLGDAADAAGRRGLAVGGQQTGVGEHPGHHEGCSDKKGHSAAPAVDIDESENGHEDVDDVLDARGDEVGRAGEASHSEYIGNIILDPC